MGQAKLRRPEIAALRHLSKPSIAAVHEAGHAVARFLTAKSFGIAASDAVGWVEMRFDGGATFGPMFSVDISEVVASVSLRYSGNCSDSAQAIPPDLPREKVEEFLCAVMTQARAAGADVATWLEAKMTHCVAGPMAEALYRRCPFAKIIASAECHCDMRDIWHAWKLARVALPDLPTDGWKHRLFSISDIVREQFSIPATWHALLTVARTFPAAGEIRGGDVWETFSRAQQNFGAAV